MSIWGDTSDWAGKGQHVRRPLHGNRCCPNGHLERIQCKDGGMEMVDRETRGILEVFQCTGCHSVWFRRAGMTGFFSIKPSHDPFNK